MEEKIHEWKFKINYQYSKPNIYIGIDDQEHENQCIETCFGDQYESNNYSISSDGFMRRNGVLMQHSTKSYETGDEVTMILNLYDKSLSYQINESEMDVMFERVGTGDDIKYKACVHLYVKDESVTLISYQCRYE